jgi:large subunit ribosomal protein L23
VRTDATKPEVKAAVELLFKVEVDAVSVVNVKGKGKRAGRTMGRRQDWKKAYVSLKPGQEINFAAGE